MTKQYIFFLTEDTWKKSLVRSGKIDTLFLLSFNMATVTSAANQKLQLVLFKGATYSLHIFVITKNEINFFICLPCPLCSENIWSFIFSYFLESFVPYCAPLLERLSNQATEKAEEFWYWPCSCRGWASWQYGALCQVWCVHHIMLYSHPIHNPFCTCTGKHNMDNYNNPF